MYSISFYLAQQKAMKIKKYQIYNKSMMNDITMRENKQNSNDWDGTNLANPIDLWYLKQLDDMGS